MVTRDKTDKAARDFRRVGDRLANKSNQALVAPRNIVQEIGWITSLIVGLAQPSAMLGMFTVGIYSGLSLYNLHNVAKAQKKTRGYELGTIIADNYADAFEDGTLDEKHIPKNARHFVQQLADNKMTRYKAEKDPEVRQAAKDTGISIIVAGLLFSVGALYSTNNNDQEIRTEQAITNRDPYEKLNR